MPKYELRLESPVDSQARIISLDAENETRPHVTRASGRTRHRELLAPAARPGRVGAGHLPPSGGRGSVNVNLANWDAHDKRWAEHAAGALLQDAVRAAERRLDDLALGIDLARTARSAGPF
jgi:hypothetical protein